MNDRNESIDTAALDIMAQRVIERIEIIKAKHFKSSVKDVVLDWFLTILGLIVAIWATWDLYGKVSSLSSSLSELAPTAEAARENISAIGVLLSGQGIVIGWSVAILGLGIATTGIGVGILMHRTSQRASSINSVVVANASLIVGNVVIERLLEEFEALKQTMPRDTTHVDAVNSEEMQ